ncbi:MAG: dihydropteroate synthase, partial [Pseudomonadota bacterium]
MTYLRPLPSIEGHRLAGGWLRFDRVEVLVRDAPPRIVPVADLTTDDLAPLLAPRPDIAGVSMARPQVMGVLNVTPDSFSDGGRHLDPEDAVAHAARLAAADILDIGGESTRPGAPETPAEVQADRILPVIAALRDRTISVDTRHAEIARAAVAAGARLVNDVSGLRFDDGMAAAVAELGTGLCITHSIETPATMQYDPRYADVLLDVYDALADRIAVAVAAGIPKDRIVADPGIGFGKTEAHNLALLRRIGLFHGLGVPLLLGVSRKGLIGRIGDATSPADRMPGTLAITLAAVAQGVQMHRVHDVAEVA